MRCEPGIHLPADCDELKHPLHAEFHDGMAAAYCVDIEMEIKVALAKWACLIIVGANLTGCASWQLNDNTLDVGGSVGDLYERQVRSNLAYLKQHPNSLPSLFIVDTGEINTQGNVGANFTIPLGNSVTRTVVSNGVSEIVAPYPSLGLPFGDQWSEKWTIKPFMKARQLIYLRAGYLRVLHYFVPEAVTTVPQVPSEPASCERPKDVNQHEDKSNLNDVAVVECSLQQLLKDLEYYLNQEKDQKDRGGGLAVVDDRTILELVLFTLRIEETAH